MDLKFSLVLLVVWRGDPEGASINLAIAIQNLSHSISALALECRNTKYQTRNLPTSIPNQ